MRIEQKMSYEQRARYRIREMAKECGTDVKGLRKSMKDFFGNDFNLYKLMEAKIFHEEYSKSIEEIEEEQFYNEGDIASVAMA